MATVHYSGKVDEQGKRVKLSTTVDTLWPEASFVGASEVTRESLGDGIAILLYERWRVDSTDVDDLL